LATLRDGEKEHGIVEPGTDVSVRRLPDLRARIDTIVGAVVVAVAAPVAVAAATSPVCKATAV
jgi:hypothetical protein